jgi:cation:H+ antiporter
MFAWTLALFALMSGLYLLTKSADFFVDGSVSLARRLHVPPLIIGFTIVGFGTSAPELLVSMLASLRGNSIIALGNVYGSNITNILLILGACMVVAPIAIHRTLLKRDIPFLLLTTIAVVYFCTGVDNPFARIEGILLFVVFILFTCWQIGAAMFQKTSCEAEQTQEQTPGVFSLTRTLLYTFGGLALLILSSNILVTSAIWIAKSLAETIGISAETTELIISVTIVALGTSLPELMASITATRKGHDDIAVGNIIGSNCFNLCMVAGLSIWIQPVQKLPVDFRCRDLYVMLFATLLVWVPGLCLWWRARKTPTTSLKLGRCFGVIYLIFWVIYTLGVVFTTQ